MAATAATGSITESTPRRRGNTRGVVIGGVSVLLSAVFFLVPFLFIFLIASKDVTESAALEFSWPENFVLFQNLGQALAARDYLMVIAFINSVILTVVSVGALVILSAMVAYVWQRRAGRSAGVINLLVLAGLIVPPAVVPTIWVLQTLGLFKTMPGLIFIEIAYGIPFCVLLFRAFITTVPRELDEAAVIDGAGSVQIFFRVIFPVLRSVIMTVIILQVVRVYNDFEHPLYFLPGTENATVQLTLLNFQSQFLTQYHLLFATILMVTIPPLIMFIFFNRKIVEGMAAGSVKG
ncbi:MAG TPA: carbohydrate ABC transporter permease [Propionibacteriaceae bacterium]|nr:carbohydrate ABC transporter permease [Propionibacteriaceae bacterium]